MRNAKKLCHEIAILFAFFVLIAVAACSKGATEPSAPFWRGNTHTHTLWSDGDGAPELVADAYRAAGYDFLVLSDHNVLSHGERWFPISTDERSRLTPTRVAELRRRFGAENVVVRPTDSGQEMRLRTLVELRESFEEAGEFLFIQGEEVTASFKDAAGRGHPVHVNAVNLARLVKPLDGASVRAVMNANVDAIVADGASSGRPVLAHINHPNFGWAMTWEDVAHVVNDRFFEIYNGHRGVNNHGVRDDARRLGTEEIWDRALVLRLTELNLGLLYGVATDDAHHYHGTVTAQMERGWVMVRSQNLDADSIVEAMQLGDFYASNGVALDDVKRDGDTLTVDIRTEPGVTYRTRFIGTRRTGDGIGAIGEVLAETDEDPARYRMTGDELYVRAVCVSSRKHPNPFAGGDLESAWVQPVTP